MTIRGIKEQPAVIHLVTSRGHISSPPLEWAPHQERLEYTFQFKKEVWINQMIVAHPDGAVFHTGETEMTRVRPGPFTVSLNLEDDCGDPQCPYCNKAT